VVTSVAALTARTPSAAAGNRALRGPSPARTAGPVTADRSPVAARPVRTVRSWPLLVLAAPAAAEVWSGWVGIAHMTGFGLVCPLPGIWPSLHLDTTITLPVGVEAYAAYALRAWLGSGQHVSPRTRRFAKWSAIGSFALGMAGQIAYHLLAQAQMTRAPWAITTLVSCLPVLVLGMGTALAHMLHADAAAADTGSKTAAPAGARSPAWSAADRAGPAQDQAASQGALTVSGPPDRPHLSPRQDHVPAVPTTRPAPPTAQPQMELARLTARQLAAAGQPVSRRALRNAGVRGSNETLNALAHMIRNELPSAGATPPPGQT